MPMREFHVRVLLAELFFLQTGKMARACTILLTHFTTVSPVVTTEKEIINGQYLSCFIDVRKLIMCFMKEAEMQSKPITEALLASLSLAERDQFSSLSCMGMCGPRAMPVGLSKSTVFCALLWSPSMTCALAPPLV